MRPVNKGNRPANYPYCTNPAAGYNGTWTFNSVGIQTIFATRTPTVDQCLVLATTIAQVESQQIPQPANYATMKSCIAPISNHISGDTGNAGYKQAAKFLLQNIGPFCSYCDSPLSGNVDVEHVAPKAGYPYFSVDWNNLVLACTACNSYKLEQPSRAWMVANVFRNQQPGNESDYVNAIRTLFAVWPDQSQGASYLAMQAGIQAAAGGAALAKPYATGQSVQSVDYTTNVVTAQVFNANNALTAMAVQVLLTPRAVGIPPNTVVTTQVQAQNTIALTRLNETQPNSIYDRRVVNRTQAWFTVLAQLSLLDQAAANAALFDAIWGMTLTLAAKTGFFSVWLKVLTESGATDPNHVLLAVRFRQECNTPLLFPGTVWNAQLQN
jgi:hypothetical protein